MTNSEKFDENIEKNSIRINIENFDTDENDSFSNDFDTNRSTSINFQLINQIRINLPFPTYQHKPFENIPSTECKSST